MAYRKDPALVAAEQIRAVATEEQLQGIQVGYVFLEMSKGKTSIRMPVHGEAAKIVAVVAPHSPYDLELEERDDELVDVVLTFNPEKAAMIMMEQLGINDIFGIA